MGPCSRCGGPRDRPGQRYCRECQNAYKREHRPRHSQLAPEERRKANARAYANVYLRRGKIKRGPCEDCRGPGEEMHHEDYDKPLKITWLCKDHHRARTNSASPPTGG